MIKYSVDITTSQLTIGTNRMSLSLLECVQIALKDTVSQIYKVDFYFKPQTSLRILPW